MTRLADGIHDSSFAGDDFVIVPVLALSVRSFPIKLDFSEDLDIKVLCEQRSGLVIAVMRPIVPSGPIVAITEELPGESAAGGKRLGEPAPGFREFRWGREGERETGEDKIDVTAPVGFVEGGHLQANPLSLLFVQAGAQVRDAFWLRVEGDHLDA